MIRSLALLLMLLMFGSSAGLQAHTGLTRSVPADGASVAQSPARLELAFSGEVRLVNLVVTDSDGAKVEIENARSMTPSKQFVIPVPALAPGRYKVDWMVMGGDSHKMTGSFSFLVAQENGGIETK